VQSAASTVSQGTQHTLPCLLTLPAPCSLCLLLLLYLVCFLPQVLTSKSEIEMWGDGKQTRSFTYIDDCVEGILRVTKSDFREPLNLGSCEMVSMNEMMQIASSFEDKVGVGTGQDRGQAAGQRQGAGHCRTKGRELGSAGQHREQG
jgi:nucleoside-diphosphate-sugar epimerase